MKTMLGVLATIALSAWLNLASATSIALALAPSSATFTAGSTINVNVNVSGLPLGGPPSIGAFDLTVRFDASLLAPQTVSFGPFLGNPLAFEALTGFEVSMPSLVELAEVSLLSPADLDALQPASFTLATLSFLATANGTSTFRFIGDERVDDAFGNKFTIPEPSSLPLLAWGIIALVGCCRRGGGNR
jgi:hypothetical protein